MSQTKTKTQFSLQDKTIMLEELQQLLSDLKDHQYDFKELPFKNEQGEVVLITDPDIISAALKISISKVTRSIEKLGIEIRKDVAAITSRKKSSSPKTKAKQKKSSSKSKS